MSLSVRLLLRKMALSPSLFQTYQPRSQWRLLLVSAPVPLCSLTLFPGFV